MYSKVDPVVIPIKTTIVPTHFPKIKPPIKNKGEPKPSKRTHIIEISKNTDTEKKILIFFKLFRVSLFDFIIS